MGSPLPTPWDPSPLPTQLSELHVYWYLLIEGLFCPFCPKFKIGPGQRYGNFDFMTQISSARQITHLESQSTQSEQYFSQVHGEFHVLGLSGQCWPFSAGVVWNE